MTLGVSNLGIDGLEDIEQIGTGGSSRVYRARQTELDRVVAVKVLNPGHDQNVAKRFDRERKAMGRLSLHEGIVPVYSSGLTTHGEPYLVMPYYANGSLQDQIDTGAMEWQTAVSYVDVAAETIAAAHDEGVVHLDLKPANILLTNNGAPRIADFGIARLTTGKGASAGTTGGAAFTPAYSAPETFLEGETGPPSDVYGLGATLWALLVGHPPFLTPGDDTNLMAVIGRVVNNPVGDLRHFTPGPICEVIERAMAKRPEERYQTAREFSLDLKNAAAASSPDFEPVDDDPRGTILFPSAAGAAGAAATATTAAPPPPSPAANGNDETQLVTQMADVELPPAIASTAPTPPPPRPLLQDAATAAGVGQAGGPPPVVDAPVFDLDRFRFGPLLLGVLAFLSVIAVAFWAINRSSSTETDGPTVDVTDPASPTSQADGSDSSIAGSQDSSGNDGQPTSSLSSSLTTSTTDASTTSSGPSSTSATTTTTVATTSSTSSSTTDPSSTTSTTDPSSTTTEDTTSTTEDTTTSTSESTTSTTEDTTTTTEDTTTTTEDTTTTTATSGPPTLSGLSVSATATSITSSFSSDQCVIYRISLIASGDPVTVNGPPGGACRTSHDVVIRDLQPDTEYRVTVIIFNEDDETARAIRTVRTAADPEA